MRLIAIATHAGLPDLTDEDRQLVQELAARGWAAEPAIWSDDRVRWDRYAAVLVRSCWDSYFRPVQYFSWLNRLDALGVRTLNPTSLLRWNFDKTHLAEMAVAGIPIIPTVFVHQGQALTLADIAARWRWPSLVFKPTISASAHETWLVEGRPGPDDEERFRRLVATSGVMVQRFVPEIRDTGEWSLCFLGGRFSHAVRKRPKSGDFRVQMDHGGRYEPADPTGDLIDLAGRIVAAAPMPALYARVDGVMTADGFRLMELEAVDPVLYLPTHPGSTGHFADLIDRDLTG